MFLLQTQSSGYPPQDTDEKISETSILEVLPQQPEKNSVDALPENVRRSYEEAENAFQAGLYSAAGSCYRKAMERATKAIDSDAEGMLNKRIRGLEKRQIIPNSMIELLDQIRLFGNSSMHEDDYDPDQADCESAREFAYLFLTYAFAMPAKVAEAKAALEQSSTKT